MMGQTQLVFVKQELQKDQATAAIKGLRINQVLQTRQAQKRQFGRLCLMGCMKNQLAAF